MVYRVPELIQAFIQAADEFATNSRFIIFAGTAHQASVDLNRTISKRDMKLLAGEGALKDMIAAAQKSAARQAPMLSEKYYELADAEFFRQLSNGKPDVKEYVSRIITRFEELAQARNISLPAHARSLHIEEQILVRRNAVCVP